MPQFNPDKHYYGKDCPHGHGGMRYRSNWNCVRCRIKDASKWASNNPGKRREITDRWAQNNPEKRKEASRSWAKSNPTKGLESAWRYRRNNREHINFLRRCQNQETGAFSHWAAKRRAAKHQATPAWFEESLVKQVYDGANRLGSHVDHIVPLQSDVVCGLHCWHNLQVLPGEHNMGKNNRYWPDMPD